MFVETCAAACINAFFAWADTDTYWNLGKFIHSSVTSFEMSVTGMNPFTDESQNVRVFVTKTATHQDCASYEITVEALKADKAISMKPGTLTVGKVCAGQPI